MTEIEEYKVYCQNGDFCIIKKYLSTGQYAVKCGKQTSNQLPAKIPLTEIITEVSTNGFEAVPSLEKKYARKYQRNSIRLKTTKTNRILLVSTKENHQYAITKQIDDTTENKQELLDLMETYNQKCLDEVGTGKIIVPHELIKLTRDCIFHFKNKQIVSIEKENISDMSDKEVNDAVKNTMVESAEELEKEAIKWKLKYKSLLRKTTDTCPSCGSKLTKRYNYKTEEYFMGCSNFEKTGCRYTRDCIACEEMLITESNKKNKDLKGIKPSKSVQTQF